MRTLPAPTDQQAAVAAVKVDKWAAKSAWSRKGRDAAWLGGLSQMTSVQMGGGQNDRLRECDNEGGCFKNSTKFADVICEWPLGFLSSSVSVSPCCPPPPFPPSKNGFYSLFMLLHAIVWLLQWESGICATHGLASLEPVSRGLNLPLFCLSLYLSFMPYLRGRSNFTTSRKETFCPSV